jgi:hypothetical protein
LEFALCSLASDCVVFVVANALRPIKDHIRDHNFHVKRGSAILQAAS